MHLKRAGSFSDPYNVENSRLDADTVEAGLAALLRETPQARVTAIDSRGVFVAMPPSLDVPQLRPLTGRSAVLLVAPDDRPAVITAWEEVRTGGASRTRVRLVGSGDEVALYLFDLRERHGVLIGVLVGASESDPAPAFDDRPVIARFALQRKTDTAVFTDVDDATTSMLGWPRDEMVGRPSLAFVHEDDRAAAVESWVDMLATPGSTRRVRLRYTHANGSFVWLELTNHNRLDDADFGCVVTECVDISDEMAAHEALRAREQLLRRIAETVPLGLLHVDRNGSVVYANERLHEILHSQATPDDPLANVAEADRAVFDAALSALVDDGEDRDLHMVLHPGSGREERVCEVSLRALTGESGAVSGAIVCVEDVTEQLHVQAELENRATYDSLTGCLNRTSILSVLAASVDAPQRVGVVFIDIDGFKRVNDSHGHATGDSVLVEAAARLRECVREGDLVGRLGGDEFLIVCPGAGDTTDMLKVAQRVVDSVRVPMIVPGARISLSASVGVAIAYEQDSDFQALIANADAAMYVAKRHADGVPVVHEHSHARRLPD
jgi:diguanylate cyclase (GGDEF)-like protein/PAS domain S-box-containing protein